MGMRSAVAPRGAVVTRIRIKSPAPTTRHGLPGPNCWRGSGRSFRLRAPPAAATSGSEKTAGRSRLTSNRRFASGRRPGRLRPGTADWDTVCADARKTPPQGMRGVLANRLRTAETPCFAAQGQSVSRKSAAEVPLTGLSFVPRGRGEPGQGDGPSRPSRPGECPTP